jgi:hypothetical protein
MLCALVAVLVGAGFLACNPNSIGRPCVNPTGVAPLGTQVSSPALECPSRLCLIHPPPPVGSNANKDNGPTCTALCESDDDCTAENDAYCRDKNGHAVGFACAVATVIGPFCCKRMCVCRTDLEDGLNKVPDGGVKTPEACILGGNNVVTCANVPGHQ